MKNKYEIKLPWVRAIFDGLLAVFSPSITIFEMINFTFSHKRDSWLSFFLLLLFFRFVSEIMHYKITSTYDIEFLTEGVNFSFHNISYKVEIIFFF